MALTQRSEISYKTKNKPTSRWSVAIFACNEQNRIGRCITSLLQQSRVEDITLYVLANGCTDNTVAVVKGYAQTHNNVHCVVIDVGDKANAWNHYVHQLRPVADYHAFVDGDVAVDPMALFSIQQTFSTTSGAFVCNAVGAIPSNGRDKKGWIQRMMRFGRLSGGLYSFSNSLISQLQNQSTKMPIGFIGEDFLATCFAKGRVDERVMNQPTPHVRISKEASFKFDSLSMFNFNDWRKYFRRLLSYQLRDYQLKMLFALLNQPDTQQMPQHVDVLYQNTPYQLGYYWYGRSTLLKWIVVYKLKQRIRRSKHNKY